MPFKKFAIRVFRKKGRLYLEYFRSPVEREIEDLENLILDRIYRDLLNSIIGLEFVVVERKFHYKVSVLGEYIFSVDIAGQKTRAHLTKEQEEIFNQTFGNVRTMYNNAVAEMESSEKGWNYEYPDYNHFKYRDCLEEISKEEYEIDKGYLEKEKKDYEEAIAIIERRLQDPNDELHNNEAIMRHYNMKEKRQKADEYFVTQRWGKYYYVTRKKKEDFWNVSPSKTFVCGRDHFENALKRYKSGISGKPRFHSKYYRKSFSVKCIYGSNGRDIEVKNPTRKHWGSITVAGLGRIKLSRRMRKLLPAHLVSSNRSLQEITFSKEPSGKFYCSFSVLRVTEVDKFDYLEALNKDKGSVREVEMGRVFELDRVIGVDLGVKNPLTIYDGVKEWVEELEKPFFKYKNELVKAQQEMSKLEKGTEEYRCKKEEVAKIHERIRHFRDNSLHQITNRLTRDFSYIVTENLSVKEMLKDSRFKELHAHIQDLAFYEFTRKLEYKSRWRGKKYWKVDRWFASSQMCSECGKVNPFMKDLSNRVLRCSCGSVLDRDVNAARNLRREGWEHFLREIIDGKSA